MPPTINFEKGDGVWFDPGSGFQVPGEILSIDNENNNASVRSTLEEKDIIVNDLRRIKLRSSDILDVEDIIQLQDDSEAAILWTLKKRHEKKRFYTFVGGILIFVNPYEKLDIYDNNVIEQYRKQVLGSQPAHLFAIGDFAYAQLIGSGNDQSIILSGESGGGKTESFRQLLRYISIVAPKNVQNSIIKQTFVVKEEKLSAANFILERFGNARTMKNNNASRFGKQLELFYKQGCLCGASFKTYLLERSRVNTQNPGERNFHIFYEMLAGIKPDLKKKFGLIAPQNYFYLNQGKCLEIVGHSDVEQYEKLQEAFDTLGFSIDQRHTIYRILAAILHLGNIYFRPKKIGEGENEKEIATLGSESELQWTAYLLQLDGEQLKQRLLFKEIESKGEKTQQQYDMCQALDIRDALARGLYNQLFEWLVQRINHIFFKADRDNTILLLDMFGFEKFHNNSFEQFCINLANERLQSFYVQTLFKTEQAEYVKEKINWEETIGAHLDNCKTVDLLIKRPHGILGLLDDECKFPKGSDESFLQKCHLNHLDKHSYGKPRNRDKAEFCVRHYSGPAWYSVEDFLDKNRDNVLPALVDLLMESKNMTLSQMFRTMKEKNKNVKPGFVASSFNESLTALLDKLSHQTCHFVRCIRPNQEKSVDKMDMQLVANQIKALGLADTAKIRKKGYRGRYTFKQFVGKYRSLVSKDELKDKTDKEITYLILSRQGQQFSDQYQIGTTTVFVKETLMDHLESIHECVAAEAALVIQKHVKSHLTRKRYKEMRSATIKLQSHVRGWNSRNRYSKMKLELYRDAEEQAKHNRRLETYEQLQKKRDRFEEEQEPIEQDKSRVTAATEYLDLPDDLSAMIRETSNQTKMSDEVFQRISGCYEECKTNHALPHDLNEYPFANFAQGNFKGHTWQVRREPIATPFLAKDSEEDYQESLKIFKLILRFMNDSSIKGEQEILVANYIVQKGLSKKQLRDEIYSQLINQTHNNSNTANAERGWLLLALCTCVFPPSDAMFKYVLNYVNVQENNFKIAIINRLLHGTYCSNTRMYPPCRLEHLAHNHKARMVLPGILADGKTAAAQVDSWCTADDFADRILRQRGIADIRGWTVYAENDDLELQISGKDFLLDAFAHIELPTQFIANRPDYVAVAKRPGPHINRYKPEATSSRSSSSGESVPSEPKPTSSPDAMVAMSASTLNRRYQQQQAAMHRSMAPVPEVVQSAEHIPPPPAPPPLPNYASRAPGMRLGQVPPSPAPPEAMVDGYYRQQIRRQPPPSYGQGSSIPDGRSVSVMSYQSSQRPQPMVPDAVMPAAGSVSYRPLSSVSDFPPPPGSPRTESIYGRMGQPMSGISVGGISRRPPPSEYSAMSFGTRIRRMQIPSKNSDVDKFLDDIFQPVLQQDSMIEDVFDSKSLAASIKGGGDQPNVVSPNPPLPAQQQFQPMMSFPQQPMMMMVPMDARMFGMQGMQSSAFSTMSMEQQQQQGTLPNSGMMSSTGMQYPMNSGFMPLQFPSFMPTMMAPNVLPPTSMSMMSNNQQISSVSMQVEPEQPQMLAPSPPSMPPEPSYPAPLPPTPPPHGVANIDINQRGQMDNFEINRHSQQHALYANQSDFMTRQPPVADDDQAYYVAKMRPSTQSARYVGPSEDDHVTHMIRDVIHGAHQEDSYLEPHLLPPEQLRRNEISQQITMEEQRNSQMEPPTVPEHQHEGPGKLPLYHSHQKQLEESAIARMEQKSKGLPPPIDEVHYWRPKQATRVVTGEEIRERSRRSSMSDTQQSPSAVPPQTDQYRSDLPRYNEWVNDSEVIREPHVERRVRQVTIDSKQPPAEFQLGFYKSEAEFSPTELHATVQETQNKLSSSRTATQERKKAPVAITYANIPWRLNVRKELFFPSEQLDDLQELDLIFYQVIQDCFKPPPFRIRPYERDSVINILRTYQIHPDTIATMDISHTVKRQLVDTARSWPLYFSRLFPVIEDRNAEFVSLLLSVSESGVRLLTRNYDTSEEPLLILDHFDFDDLDRADVPEPRVLWLVTRRGIQVRLYSDKAEEIKALIEEYLYGPQQGKQFVRALSDYVTKEANLLSFNKDDIIQVLFNKSKLPLSEEQSEKNWLYGKLNNRYGNFPADYTEPIGQFEGIFQTYGSAGQDQFIEGPTGFPMDEQWISSNGSAVPSQPSSAKEKLTMMEFAMMYFRHSPQKYEMVRNDDGTIKGTLKTQDKKSKKEWTWRDISDQVKFTKDPIQHSLLRLESSEFNKMAIDAFLCIMRYMGDYPLKKGQALTDCVYELLMICHRNPPMRDEIYCQIIKQTTNNKSARPDSAIKGWRLFSILTAYFDCSDVLKPYLIKYLSDAAGDTRRAYHGTALVCLQNTKKTFKYGGRKFLLSAKEIEAMSLGKNLKRQIYHLPGGHKKVINTKSVTVVEEIIRDLCNELNIRSSLEQQEFCLCYILEQENAMKLLANDEYVLDVTTELEHKGKEYFCLLKRTVWIHPVRLDNDLYIDVMFFQLVPDYLEGLLIVMRTADSLSAALMDDISKMAALLHFSDEDNRPQSVSSRTVGQLLPRVVHNLRHITLEQWADRVNRKISQMPSTLTCREARARFLEVLQAWPLFGSTFFYITNVTDPRIQGECLLAINRNGIQFLHIITHETLIEFRLSEVLSTHKVTAAPPMGGQPMQFLDLKVGNLLQQRVLTLQTEQGTEISRLLGQYIYVDSQNRGFIAAENPTVPNGY